MCVYCNRSQKTSQRVKNKKVRHETKSSGVTVVLYTLWHLLWSITVHTHTNLFALYNKNLNDLLKNLGGMKKEKQVCWRDLAWIWRHLCACQQPMKMHTEVTLLYKYSHTTRRDRWLIVKGAMSRRWLAVIKGAKTLCTAVKCKHWSNTWFQSTKR